ncbi:MAG: Na/Pi cotransporter family protein [Phycisphaeraceae bacterium]|nr:Na/Pi cotransporter family protein [Phycisphaeraceae bacterium]
MNTPMLVTLAGSIGLFLVGMILLTDGLKAVAGDALRRLLTKAVSNQWTGAMWGAILTALVQSSTATSLVTIGLVSAGLLTFTQAVGVILGANIGTTGTSWLVAAVGLKISLSTVALPMIAFGAVMRLFGKGRWSAMGFAIAGFGLLFVGIDGMATGMADLSERFDPSQLPRADGLVGRLLLILIGLAMTVVVQSSSAAAATTITALYAGAISIDQATAMIVGQSVGTCFTALMTIPGAPTAAKRTALAHVMFNVIIACAVFFILPAFTDAVVWFAERAGAESASVQVAIFHTTYKLTAALIFLPFALPFANLIEWMLPQRGPRLIANLDDSVADVAEVGVEAARRSIAGIAAASLDHAMKPEDSAADRLHDIDESLSTARSFLTKLGSSSGVKHQQERMVSLLHSIDHAERLAGALHEHRLATQAWPEVNRDAGSPKIAESLGVIVGWMKNPVGHAPVEEAEKLSKAVASWRKDKRESIIDIAATGEDARRALERLDAIRWIDRVAYHAWRLTHHLHAPGEESEPHAELAAKVEPHAP